MPHQTATISFYQSASRLVLAIYLFQSHRGLLDNIGKFIQFGFMSIFDRHEVKSGMMLFRKFLQTGIKLLRFCVSSLSSGSPIV